MTEISSSQDASTNPRRVTFLKRVAIVVLVIVCSLASGLFVVAYWAEKQVLNTDNWVALVAPLPRQKVVSDALGGFIAGRVFPEDTVKAELTDALPPRASFLASPLTEQLQSITVKASQRVVAGDGFQSVWTGANRLAMNRLLEKSRGTASTPRDKLSQRFNLNLSGSSGQLRSALGSLSSAIPTLEPRNQRVVAVTTDLRASAEKIRQLVRSIDFAAAVLPMLVLASILWVVTLTENRRRAVMVTSVCIIVVLLAELIAIKAGKQAVLSQVQEPTNLPAVGYIYDTLLAWLRSMVEISILFMALVFVGSVLSGPSRLAVAFRRLTRIDRIHIGPLPDWWHASRVWVGRYKLYLWLGTFIAILALLATVLPINPRTVMNGLLLLALILAIIQLLADRSADIPHGKLRTTS